MTAEKHEMSTPAKVVATLLVTAVLVGVSAVLAGYGEFLVFVALAAVTIVIVYAGIVSKDGLTKWMAFGWVVAILVTAALFFVPADAFDPKPEKEIAVEQSTTPQPEASLPDTTKVVTDETDMFNRVFSSPKYITAIVVFFLISFGLGWISAKAVSK